MNVSSRPRRDRSDAGLTLTELMIAMLLFSMLAAGVMVSLVGQQKTMQTQDRTNTAVDNARSTLNVMARQVRMAMAGMTDGLVIVNDTTGPWQAAFPNCVNGAVPALQVFDGGPGASDTLALIYPEGQAWGSLQTALAEVDTSVVVRTYVPPLPAAATPLALPIVAGDWVMVTNLKRAMAFLATGAPTFASPDYTIPKGAANGATYFEPSISAGAFVFKASWLAYRINPTFFGGGEPVAEVIAINKTTPDILGVGVIGEPAASGIEDLQIALGIDGLNGNPVDGQISSVGAAANDDEWVYNVDGDSPPNCAQIANLLAVRITLVARSTSQVPGVQLVRPAVENRVAAVATDGYYRVMLQQIVAVRNRI